MKALLLNISDKQKEWLALGLLCVIAALLRFVNLGVRSLWLDEIQMLYRAAASIPAIIGYCSRWVAPPLRYLIHHGIYQFSKSDFWFRFPSALFAVLTVPVVFYVGKRLYSPMVGFVAATLLVISPIHLKHSADCKMYTLFIFFSLISYYTLAEFINDRRKLRWKLLVAFVPATVINMYLSYFSLWFGVSIAIICAGFTLYWLVFRRTRLNVFKIVALAMASLLIVNLYGPWMPYVWGFVTRYRIDTARTEQHLETIEDANVRKIQEGKQLDVLPRGVVFPYQAQLKVPFFHSVLRFFSVYNPACYLFLLLFLLGMGATCIKQRAHGIMLAVWFVVPFLILAKANMVFFAPRYFLFMLPQFLLCTAAGTMVVADGVSAMLKSNNTKRIYLVAGVVLAAVLVAANVPEAHSALTQERQDWKAAAAYLKRACKPGDALVCGANAIWSCILFYAPELEDIELVYNCRTLEKLHRVTAANKRTWFVTAYYGLYRKPRFFSWLEKHYVKVLKIPGSAPENDIHIFLRESPY